MMIKSISKRTNQRWAHSTLSKSIIILKNDYENLMVRYGLDAHVNMKEKSKTSCDRGLYAKTQIFSDGR